MKSKAILLCISLCLLLISTAEADDPPSGTLSVYPTVVYAGDNITITVEGSDDIDIAELWAQYNGTWNRYDCVGIQQECNHSWIITENLAGYYEYCGFVRDNVLQGRSTTPECISINVISTETTTTTIPGTTTTVSVTTTTIPWTTTTTIPGTTTTVSVTTTTLISPLISLDIVKRHITYAMCLILQQIWFIVGCLASLLLIMAGIRYITSEEPRKREEAKSRIIQVIVGLIIILITVPFVNYLIKGTDIMRFECDNLIITTTTTIPGTTTTTLPGNWCIIRAVKIAGIWFNCGDSDGICPEQFNDGSCPPGSVIVCDPSDPDPPCGIYR